MSILIALIVGGLVFASGLMGLYLQSLLPKHHMSGGSRDMILAVIGLLTLLLALVLGTLVGNTYAFFANQKAQLETFSSRTLLFDQALEQYGPETKPLRDLMRQGLEQSYGLFWKGSDTDPKHLRADAALTRWKPIVSSLTSLNPATETQKEALSAAKLNLALMEQTRLLMSLQLASPITWSLVVIVVAWSLFLFCGFGVLSGANATTLVALGLGAVSVASAVYLILDLSQPYSGYFRVSPASIEQTIEAIDKNSGAVATPVIAQ